MENTICKVSVIIPIYNAEQYLEECLSSLAKQTQKEIEIIMVNDGSTDNSREICLQYQQMDSRFILLDQENGGSAAARKAGMLRARGEYIGFMDADDWAEPEMYEILYETGSRNDSDIVFCNCYRDDGKKQIKCTKYIRNGAYDRQQIVDEILPRTLAGLDEKGRNHVIRWANYLRIYKRALIEKYQIYNDPRFRRCQDLQLTFEATLHANRYYYLGDKYLYHNRVVRESQSRGYTKNQWQKIRILIERLYEDVKLFPDLDLKSQMDLCTFFFAVYSVSNEGKKCKGVTEKEHQKKLEEISGDSLIINALETIPKEKLSKVNRKYYEAFNNKNVFSLVEAIQFEKKEKRKHAIKEKILSVDILRKIYCFVRK